MAYVCLGFPHQTAPLELRERLIVESSALGTRFSNFVLLSTCNRVEVYATTDSVSAHHQNGDTAYELLQAVSMTCKVEINELNRYAALYFDGEVVRHLFHVAAGLKSQVVGEPEILGQVSRALKTAEREDSLDPTLRRLFRHAIKVGRRARAQTRIGHHSCSFATITLKLASQYLGDGAGKNVLLVGAGSIAASFVKQLRSAQTVNIVSRSLGPAQRLAAQVDGNAFEIEKLEDKLAEADLVVTSTSSNEILIEKSAVERALAKRNSQPLLIVDLAVPRNVAVGVEQIPGVRRFDIEDLNSIVESGLEKRLLEVPLVEEILYEELVMFFARTQSDHVGNNLSAQHHRLEEIRVSELKKIQSNDALESRVCELLDQFSQALVQRILQEQVKPMQSTVDSTMSAQNNAFSELFNFDFDRPISWGGFESDSNPTD